MQTNISTETLTAVWNHFGPSLCAVDRDRIRLDIELLSKYPCQYVAYVDVIQQSAGEDRITERKILAVASSLVGIHHELENHWGVDWTARSDAAGLCIVFMPSLDNGGASLLEAAARKKQPTEPHPGEFSRNVELGGR